MQKLGKTSTTDATRCIEPHIIRIKNAEHCLNSFNVTSGRERHFGKLRGSFFLANHPIEESLDKIVVNEDFPPYVIELAEHSLALSIWALSPLGSS